MKIHCIPPPCISLDEACCGERGREHGFQPPGSYSGLGPEDTQINSVIQWNYLTEWN